jgi:hypothetical protein
MASETANVCDRLKWLGRADVEHPPGDIEPKLALLITDEGIGSDVPFALDYRASFGQPRVLQYRWRLTSIYKTGNRWVEVASDFPSWLHQLN